MIATDDLQSDGGESVRIGFGALPDGVLAGRPAAAVVTLADGTEQTFLVSFGTNPTFHVQAREGNVGKRFGVYLSNDLWGSVGNAEPRRPVTIPLVVTYRGGASEADHTPIPASVTFAAGQSEASFSNRVADVLGLSPLAGLENLGLSGNRIADIGLLGHANRPCSSRLYASTRPVPSHQSTLILSARLARKT